MSENFGLKTLEKEGEINTYKVLCEILYHDEANAPEDIAAVVRLILQIMPAESYFVHIWGVDREKTKVKEVIRQLREAMVNRGKNTPFPLCGY